MNARTTPLEGFQTELVTLTALIYLAVRAGIGSCPTETSLQAATGPLPLTSSYPE